jgi:hypothetical protein
MNSGVITDYSPRQFDRTWSDEFPLMAEVSAPPLEFLGAVLWILSGALVAESQTLTAAGFAAKVIFHVR